MKRLIMLTLIISLLSAMFIPNAFASSADLNGDRIDINSPEVQKELEEAEKLTDEMSKKVYTDEELIQNREFIKQENPEMYEEIMNSNQIFSGQMGRSGNILITYDQKTSGWRHGHAAIVKSTGMNIVEAMPKVGVRIYKNNWGTRFSDKKKMYVVGSTQTQSNNAQSWATAQSGKPYDLLAGKHTEQFFYCSHLVWKAWKTQGYDLDGNGGVIVTPADLEKSSKTKVY